MTSSIILGLYVLVSVALKCSSTIVFLTPCLGMFNLGRHYQAERWPFWASSYHESLYLLHEWIPDENVYLPGKDPIKWSELSRLNYTDPKNPVPYDDMYTLYTYFHLMQNGFHWIGQH